MNKWVSLTKPTKAYRLEKYRMAASLDGVLEVHGGAIPFEDPQTGEVVMLEGKGCCEIKTQGYNDGPPTYENILQVQAQMLCSGFKWAIIGKLGPRLKFEMFVFKADGVKPSGKKLSATSPAACLNSPALAAPVPDAKAAANPNLPPNLDGLGWTSVMALPK